MAYAVFAEVPWVDYGYSDDLPVEVQAERGPFWSDRYQLADIGRRRYTLPFWRTSSERASFDAFFKGATVLYTWGAWLFEDPKDAAQTAVSLGTGDGSTTTFSLPTTGEQRRYYPKQGSVVVRVAGTPVTVSSVSTDGRTVTLASPPAGAAAVEADYTGLRLVRLVAPYAWQAADQNWWNTTLDVLEVVTD